MATGSVTKRRWPGSIVVLSLITLIGGVLWANQRDRITPPPSAPVSLEVPAGQAYPTFAVLGDSYAEGYGPGWASGWVRLLSDRMCWTLTPASGEHGAGIQHGTGFTTAGRDPGTARYLDRVPAVTAGKPDVVLVEGGLNDQGAPTSEEITAIAARTFTAIKERIPTGTVVAIGPLMTTGQYTVPEELRRVSAALAAAAGEAGIPYISPIDEQWLATDPNMFSSDEIHPNRDGYREFTRRLMDDLKTIGLTSSCK
ncbi:lysophospholipase L1-like esterase [Mycobacterium sp. OAS707]|uniref:SGNH/GDSL hydrolase family protein n=1 Tax=Mycobacterium sp. OAS707 TaxID=2663822 RepID=UPI00178B39D8|nr:SGNH/GDSL hydrolase family protein [Mycobacterium sp. OAS707]MBE1547980.1 lysophospholipase L1-like esterase [Mycobacterium sp. OAS707]